jgi:5-methylcytosine-specific restriction endonuclease McrA
MPGCARRRGLEAHHLVPRTWGGTDEIANLAVVCPSHHRDLVPHGTKALVGNPNRPDGLRLVDAADLPPPRAGLHAA